MCKLINGKFVLIAIVLSIVKPASCLGADISIYTSNLGDYVNMKYISALEGSHSPLLAQRAHLAPQVISIKRRDDTLIVSEVINWHEGCIIGVTILNKQNEFTYGDCDDSKSIEMLDKNNISLNGEKYVYVGESVNFLGWTLLGGACVDEHGLSYQFDANGAATFPGRSVHYELCLDQIVPPCSDADIFYDKDKEKAYAFKIHEDTLSLYDVPDSEMEYVDFTKPIAILHKKYFQ